MLRSLSRRALPTAGGVHELHEALCFLRALPDDARVLAEVERMLAGFAARADLRRHRRRLAESGIAGTSLSDRMTLPMAAWLARRAPEGLHVEWSAETRNAVEAVLPLLVLFAEQPALDEYAMPVRDWLALMRREDETDAAFLARRVASLPVPPSVRDHLWESLDLPLVISVGARAPSRTCERLRAAPATFRTRPLERGRPDLREALRRKNFRVRRLGEREARAVIELAQGAMVVRHRALDVFSNADPRDVSLVDAGDGVQFANIGVKPEHRLLLESVYGFLMLRNGVPTGYVLASALFNSCEIAYNVFPTWRGGDAARVYGQVITMAAQLFGADSFAIDPYQLGHENREGLDSGAWWFYQKLGFRAKDPEVLALMERELAVMRRDPSHRSPPAILRQLVRAPVFFHAGRERPDVMGHMGIADVGAKVMRAIGRRFGAEREDARRTCLREARQALGLTSLAGWSPAERLWLERWAPLVLDLPGLSTWKPTERRALVQVIRAKASRREADYVRRFDAHRPLRTAIRALAHDDWQ
jgi:hypothetical protein